MYFLTLSIYFVGAFIIKDSLMADKLNFFGDMVVFSAYAMQVIMSFLMLAMIFMMLPRAQVSARRINEVLDTDISMTDGEKMQGLDGVKGEVEFKNVSFSYPDAGDDVIHDISFTAHRGETVALIGATGSGKSTIINLLTNLLKPDKGNITRSCDDVRYMPDDINFPDTLTAEEIISFLGGLKKVSIEKQAELLQQVGLTDAKKMKVGQFSKGMRQRLNLAQSLMGDSALFILDEPTNGLDPYWIAQLKEMLQQQRNNNQMVLFSTHLLSLAEEIADEVILIHHGHILATGAIDTLLVQYKCQTLEQLWLQLTKQEGTQ